MKILATFMSFRADHFLPWIVLYIGPDVFLPITSALAAIAGFLLMFWQRIIGFVYRVFGRGDKHAQAPGPKPGPKN